MGRKEGKPPARLAANAPTGGGRAALGAARNSRFARAEDTHAHARRHNTSTATVWVRYIVGRLVSQSAIGQPNKPSTAPGANWNAAASPRSNGLPVNWTTSHDWATAVIHVPTSDIPWPAKNSR